MLLKTRNFDQQLSKDIEYITINKNQPYRLKGSYSRKSYGDPISDIDYTGRVRYNNNLLYRLSQIIGGTDGPFTFIQFGCGIYDEFKVPWTIDSGGDCKYSQITALDWVIRLKNLVPDIVWNIVYIILSNPTISICQLIEITKMLNHWAEIKWNASDVKRGYIIVRDIRYDLINIMKSVPAVLEFAYTTPDGQHVCGIDIGLDDFNYQKGLPDVMYKYYTRDLYAIFKSYQKRLKPEAVDAYRDVQKKIEVLVVLRYQLEMIATLTEMGKYGLVFIIVSSMSDNFNKFDISPTDINLAIANITTRIESEVLGTVESFETILSREYIQQIKSNLQRGEEGRIPREQSAIGYTIL